MNEEGSQLATELVESQKMRAELLKWKIVLVATLGAVGLGLVETSGSGRKYADLVLCAIPLVTAYVDLLARQMSLRVQVIGCYRRQHPNVYGEYELFAAKAAKEGAFALDSIALVASSAIACGTLVVLPWVLGDDALGHATAIQVSGGLGLLLTVATQGWYKSIENKVKQLEPDPS